MLFQACRDLAQLVVNTRHDFLQLRNMHWCANAGNYIFALRIHQKFPVKFFHSRRRIACEPHACAAGLAQIAEHHRLHIHRSAQHIVDVVDSPLVLGAIVLP